MKKTLFALSAALAIVGCSRDADTDTTTVSDNNSRNRNYGITNNSIINEPAGSAMNPGESASRVSNTNANSDASSSEAANENGNSTNGVKPIQ